MLHFTKHSKKHSILSSLKNTPTPTLLTIVFLLNVSILTFYGSFTSTTAFAETDTSLNLEKDKIQWLKVHYPPNGTGIVQVIDQDMNLDSETVDYFDVDVWSDSDQAGIDLTVTETGKSTGIFEGTVFFAQFHSTNTTVRVTEVDFVTAKYEYNPPMLLSDSYTTTANNNNDNNDDDLYITTTTYIGSSPYNPCSYANYRDPMCRPPTIKIVDAFDNTLSFVNVGQQIQISTDFGNGHNEEQPFMYLVQIQNSDELVVSLEWIAGSISAGQSFSLTLPWTPSQDGNYTATAFVWESLDASTVLSMPTYTAIEVLAE